MNNFIDSFNSLTESTKNMSEASKNFTDVMNSFLGTNLIRDTINESHKKIIEKIVETTPPSQELIEFLSGYEKMIKHEKRKKDIAQKAKDFLEHYAEPQKITEDWLEFFFEKAKLVSNQEMQLIWSKLLAEESNHPGKITPSLLHALSIMTFEQANSFCNISRFALREFKKNTITPLLFISTNATAYRDSNISPSKLKELERFGLINCEFGKEYVIANTNCEFEKEYTIANEVKFVSGNNLLTVYGDPNNENKIKAGNVVFTKDGRILYDIIGDEYKAYRADILDFIIVRLKKRNCRVMLNNKEL